MTMTAENASSLASALVAAGMMDLDGVVLALVGQVGDYRTKLLLNTMIEMVDMPAVSRSVQDAETKRNAPSASGFTPGRGGEVVVRLRVTKCNNNTKIRLIKRVRELFQIGLKEAKDFVENNYNLYVWGDSLKKVLRSLEEEGAQNVEQTVMDRPTDEMRKAAYSDTSEDF